MEASFETTTKAALILAPVRPSSGIKPEPCLEKTVFWIWFLILFLSFSNLS